MKFLKLSAIVPAMAIFFSCLVILAQSAHAQNQTLIFSVTGDIPYSSSEETLMQEQIAEHNLYSPSEFFVHIGDIKSGSGSCSESVYQKARDYLLQLQVPTFITPGDNEWIDCSNPPQAWNFWVQYFMNFEQNFCPVPGFQKQSVRPENFAWVQKGVLLIGISMPGGSEGTSAKARRLQDDADWVNQQFQAHGSQVRAAVIFAHNMDTSADKLFIDQLIVAANNLGKPILYIHGSGHSWKQDNPLSAKNVMRVQVDNGGAALPVQVTVTTNNPATFVFNRDPWNSNSQPINRPPCGQTSAPAITVNPSSHDYGQVAVGSNSSQTFVVSNSGNASLEVTGTTLTGGEATEFGIVSGGGSYMLSPGQTRNVVVRFNPGSEGDKSTTLRFESNAGTKDISLTGTGITTTTMFNLTTDVVGDGSISLDPLGGTYEDGIDVTVTAMPAAGFVFSGWSGDLSGPNNPMTINMNANKSVTATFEPSDPGGSSTIVHEETQTGGSTGSTSVATSTSLVGVGGRLYLAAISNRSNRTVTSVTGLGLTWTRVKAQCSTRGRLGLEVWKAQGAPSGNGVVTATFSAAPDNAAIAVSRYSGVDAANPIGNIISGNLNGVNGTCTDGSESNAYSFNLATTTNGVMVYGAISMRQETHTPGAGYTERADRMQGSGSNAASVAVEEKSFTSAGTAVVNGTFSNSVYWAMIGVELKPQSGTGPTQYSLTVNTSGSGSVLMNPLPNNGTYDDGTTVTLTATPDAGFQFSNWSGDATGTAGSTTVTMDGNKTVTATFTEISATQYTLTVGTAGSGTVSLNPLPNNGTYNDGTVVTLTATPDPGFQFSGWSGDASGATSSTTVTMNGNKAVTATFTVIPPAQYTLNVTPVGSGTVSLNPPPNNGTYTAGMVVELTATPEAGFQFSGWSGDLSGPNNPMTINMNANKSVTATFEPSDPGGSGMIIHEETQTGGSTGSTSVATSASLVGVGDRLYLAAISNRSNRTVTSVTGLGLTWTRVKAQCSTRGRLGLEVWKAQGTPTGNGVVTATFSAAPDNAAIAVSRYSGVNAANPIGNIISGNLNGINGTCTDGSESNAYSFNLATTTNGVMVYGAISMRQETHTPGAGYTERADRMQGSGSTAASVAVEDKSFASAGTAVVNGTFSNSVYWAMIGVELKPQSGPGPTQYSLTVNTSGSGSVLMNPLPNNGTYDDGTTVTLTATPDAGFQFSNWSGDATGTAGSTTVTMDGNKTVTATFTEISATQYTLTVGTAGSGTVSLNPLPNNGTYNDGTVVTLTATPDAGSQFSGWNGDATGTASSTTVTMNGNKTVTATFTPINPGGGGTIAHEETQTGGSTGATSVATSTSLVGVSGHLYLAAISNRSNRSVTSVTGLGLTWTRVKTQCSTKGRLGLEVWKAQGTPSGNDVVTAAFSATPDNAAIAVSRYSGVNAANPIGNIISGNLNGVNGTCADGSESNAYSFNLATTTNGVMVYGAISMRQETHTPGAGYTERADRMQGSGSNAASVAVEEKSFTSAGTALVNGTFSNSVYWAVIGLELKP